MSDRDATSLTQGISQPHGKPNKIGDQFKMNRQQMLEKVENLSAYEVKDRRFVEEMNSEGIKPCVGVPLLKE